MVHAAIAVIVQLIAGFGFGAWWTAALAASAFFIGREITQAEYRWIEEFGDGHRANMPWWGGFAPRVWSLKSLTDVIAPLAVTTGLALIAS